jgi:hypothetical protein
MGASDRRRHGRELAKTGVGQDARRLARAGRCPARNAPLVAGFPSSISSEIVVSRGTIARSSSLRHKAGRARGIELVLDSGRICGLVCSVSASRSARSANPWKDRARSVDALRNGRGSGAPRPSRIRARSQGTPPLRRGRPPLGGRLRALTRRRSRNEGSCLRLLPLEKARGSSAFSFVRARPSLTIGALVQPFE